MRKLALLLALPVALWVTTASAAIVTYTSAPAWNSAVGPVFVEPFNNSGLQPFTGVDTINGTISGNLWLDAVTLPSPPFDGDTTTFSYLPGTLAAAGGFWNTAPGGEGTALLLTLNMTGGGTQVVGQIGPINGFFGWTSTLQFDSFTISAGTNVGSAETFNLDNLSFSQTLGSAETPVPEPGTLALVGTGLVGLGLRLRRKLTGR